MKTSVLANVAFLIITLGAPTPVFSLSIKEDECPVNNQELCEVWEVIREEDEGYEQPPCVRSEVPITEGMYEFIKKNLGKLVPITPDTVFYNNEDETR